MNSWMTVKVKYTKQLEDGTFKRVTEPYLLAAMTFTDAEARIYEELGTLIRGEFLVVSITRTDIHDIFWYHDTGIWYKCGIVYDFHDGEEGAKSKKIRQLFLVEASSVKEANDRLKESLGGMMIDYEITGVVVSPIVDIFPFGEETEDQVAAEFERQVKSEVAEHAMGRKTVFSSPGSENGDSVIDDQFGEEEE